MQINEQKDLNEQTDKLTKEAEIQTNKRANE
jgi:hypothetical protein